MLVAIDPGPSESAWIRLRDGKPLGFGKNSNYWVMSQVVLRAEEQDQLAIEMVASYGMPVGQDVFETCVWIGRFIERFPGPAHKVYRKEVVLHVCGSTKAKDSNVRQALIDRFGGKEKAIGRKKSPGLLYGMAQDAWQALAVGITYWDRRGK